MVLITLVAISSTLFGLAFLGSISPPLGQAEGSIKRLSFVFVWLVVITVFGLPGALELPREIAEERALLTANPWFHIHSHIMAFGGLSFVLLVLLIESLVSALNMICVVPLIVLFASIVVGALFQVLRPDRYYEMMLRMPERWYHATVICTLSILLALIPLASFLLSMRVKSVQLNWDTFFWHLAFLVVLAVGFLVILAHLEKHRTILKRDAVFIDDYNRLERDIGSGAIANEEEAERRFDDIRQRVVAEGLGG